MTAHDHREYVDGCSRCDLSRSEVGAYQRAYEKRAPRGAAVAHGLIASDGVQAVCACGALLSVYGTTRTIMAALAQHVTEANARSRDHEQE